MLLYTIAPTHQMQESLRRSLAASLLQPLLEKVDHQGRDAGSLVDHQMPQPAVQFRGNPAVQHGDIGGSPGPAGGRGPSGSCAGRRPGWMAP